MAILMSIKPEFSRQIFSGKKKYELRKTPIKNNADNLVIVYESAPTKAVVGYFGIGGILKKSPIELWSTLRSELGISEEDFLKYFKGKQWAYAIKVAHIRKFKKKIPLQRLKEKDESWSPPQSFYYLKGNSKTNSLLMQELENFI